MDFCPLSMINKTQHIELSLSLHTDQRKFRAKMCANFLSLVQETLRNWYDTFLESPADPR